ncbi:hypothetical protein NLJ89_g6795 [Agrocybe chaxingu]|uniref:HD domain-containing protein n=1 Tax=Agrocybe chaxingu TaxID=84603 RepID=A0A9W8JXX1_9AGAR|nr:hypothetical protein NLJ89_g6795 [Agrocybe chaxingu]
MLDHDELDQVDHPEDPPNAVRRHIKDPIHNYIPVHPLLSRFIDTKQFQRLRNIKQLGTTCYVWPGGSHTRFEHCLARWRSGNREAGEEKGVAFLARQMATHLQKSQPDLEITDRDVRCVEIAGLCHDLGHGPWSHVWDGLFIPAALPGAKWKHEDASEMMFEDMVKKNKIPISKQDQEFVMALIAGEHSRVPHEKAFLFDIVANQRNGLDVDKFDYIHRDSHMIGEPIHLSLARLVHSARVLDDQICYDIKDANQIYEICQARFKLHKIFYNHKAAKAIEYMIIDGLMAAQPYMKIAECITDPNKFLYLTDGIMPRIESSEEPELEPARKIFDRIHERNLYKCVDYKVIDWPHRELFRANITKAAIVKEVRALRLSEVSTPVLETTTSVGMEDQTDVDEMLAASASAESMMVVDGKLEELEEEDVIVDFSMMHYGKKEKNPLDFVRFYSKRNTNQSQKAERGVYSNLTPQYFAEDLLRVYTKKPQFFGLAKKARQDSEWTWTPPNLTQQPLLIPM